MARNLLGTNAQYVLVGSFWSRIISSVFSAVFIKFIGAFALTTVTCLSVSFNTM